ncbi:MAG: MFS transporter, partial [Burkholderiaceae bacterium]
APAIAPIIGGWFTVWWGWKAVFWFLAGVGGLLWVANARLLPETLYPPERQPFNVSNLLLGYRELATSPRFLLLALASGVPFNGMFLYVMAAPVFLGRHLGLAPTQFFWLFLLVIGGIMSGAWLSGRLAGRITPKAQVQRGFYVMLAVSLLNLARNWLWAPHAAWALLPIGLYSFGWALMTPVVTLLVLDLHPNRRGMASSMQSFVGAVANGLAAGVLAPLVMDSTRQLALTSASLMTVGLGAWLVLRWRFPQVGASTARG